MNVELASNRELDARVLIADRKRTFLLFCDLTTGDAKEWLVKGLLGHGEASAFYGKPGDGKSVLVEDLCLHVAAGWPWHGRPVRRGAVVYIALERKKLVERRAIAFRERHNPADLPFAMSAVSMISATRGQQQGSLRLSARSRMPRRSPSSSSASTRCLAPWQAVTRTARKTWERSSTLPAFCNRPALMSFGYITCRSMVVSA
jgi:hypothetical protein